MSLLAAELASLASKAAPVVTAAVFVLGVILWLRRTGDSKNGALRKKRLSEIMASADPEQVRMMQECVILLDEDDNVIGHGSKKDTHLMANIRKGMLHRAFSVFMFNDEGKLLLQQRSPEKITFPHYWANTCCSHPLYVDSELDGVDGVINAARRKLKQELGVDPAEVPPSCFKFLTRVHYKAASDDIWGEHEIDYILVCTPPKTPTIRPNKNEVATVRWFAPQELREWVAASRSAGVLVSPWFRIIENTLLHKWWDGLRAGSVSQFVDDKIHRAGDFTDPVVSKALGLEGDGAGAAAGAGAGAGAGTAASSSGFESAASSTAPGRGSGSVTAGDASKKQGSYGKVVTHKEPLLRQLMHVDEVFAALRFKLAAKRAGSSLPADTPTDYVWCEGMMCKVSRSFAAVIQQLPEGLRESVAIFYLALRALDTVEDDMDHFDDVNVKVAELLKFAEHLRDPAWTMHGIGFGDEARLLEGFNKVATVFLRLPASHQAVIEDITVEMAKGMARFIQRDLKQGTKNGEEYNLYCHFVAGLVGHGLSRLFSASGLEAESVAEDLDLANDMGLFLQKTNIIRDYLEDWVDQRAFWPATTWRKHAASLGDFCYGANGEAGLACLNEMVTNALGHAPRCLEYMTQLRDPSVFKFCAIPQVMAIATLEKCFNNPKVFTGVVKIRKGTACKLIYEAKDMPALYRIFLRYSRRVIARVNPSDPSARATLAAAGRVEAICMAALPDGGVTVGRCNPLNAATAVVAFAFAALMWAINGRRSTWGGHMPRLTMTYDVFLVALAAFCVVYLLCFSLVPFVSGIVAEPRAMAKTKLARFGGSKHTLDVDDDVDFDADEDVDVPVRPTSPRARASSSVHAQ